MRYFIRLTVIVTIVAVVTVPAAFFILTAFGVEGTTRTAVIASIGAAVSSVVAMSALPPRRVPPKR